MESEKAAFMGKVTAATTHELKNVLAIIKESAGLMEDIIAMTDDNTLPHKPKYVRSISRILDQVARGVELSTRLNAFAHSSDEVRARVDLNTAGEQIGFACHRPARMKGIVIKALPAATPVWVEIDQMQLQMFLCSAVELLLNVLEPGSVVTVQASAEPTPLLIICEAGDVGPSRSRDSLSQDNRWEQLMQTARSMNLRMEEVAAPTVGLRVVFPD